MIEGTVNAALEAVVSLPVQGPAGHTLEIDAVIDTGFSRFLTLPSEFVAELGLALTGVNRVFLADGSEATVDVYEVTVIWDGQARNVLAYAADTDPLIRYVSSGWLRLARGSQARRSHRHPGYGVAAPATRTRLRLRRFGARRRHLHLRFSAPSAPLR